MRLEELDYDLPPDRIAQSPREARGTSRLLVLDRVTGRIEHRRFSDLPELLRRGDLLVRNDSRVLPARLRGSRARGGHAEILLLRRLEGSSSGELWTCLARPGRRLRDGEEAIFPGGIVARWVGSADAIGVRRVHLRADEPISAVIERVGEVPLPPYIRRAPDRRDRDAYQTVYARDHGSAAAPTAGLHFTEASFEELRARGVRSVDVTLHVGPATFLPLRHSDQDLPAEEVVISESTATEIRNTKRAGQRIVAVGTTVVRALEGRWGEKGVEPGRDEVGVRISPGFSFHVVDALITNFHLPRSSLLSLVSAFAGIEPVREAYRQAIDEGYRFYSYGDAMLIQ